MKEWSLNNNVYCSEFTVGELIDAIRVFEVLKTKYPNNETIKDSIELLRNEACNIFGGSIYRDISIE
jgi:hypothetical protein